MLEKSARNTSEVPKFPNDISIAFSYPYGNGFDPNFLESVMGLLLYECSKTKEERVLGSILKKGSCYVDGNRDGIAIDFINTTQDTHLVMVDPDVGFPANLLEQFANTIRANPEAKVIAARVDLLNGLPVFYKCEANYSIHQPFPFRGVREFDRVGTGIICIAREVFVTLYEKLGHPHFFHKIIDESKVQHGDDLSFCMTAKEHGFKIYGAWEIYGQHYRDGVPVPKRYLEENDLIVHRR